MRPTRILRSGVDFIVKENARIISLNRPKALNALNHPMVKEMRPQLEKWKERGKLYRDTARMIQGQRCSDHLVCDQSESIFTGSL